MATWAGLAGAAAALLVSLWLSLWALPAAEDQVRVQELAASKGREQAERTLTSSLTNAVVTGDYGEVQNMLSYYESLGYVQAAAVLNSRGKVVAMVGAPGSLQMGAEPGTAAVGQFDSVSLGQGDNRGQLLRPAAAPVQPAAITIHLARFLAAAAALGSALALGVLARPLWQARRKPAVKAKRR